jgi:hypothetical protein
MGPEHHRVFMYAPGISVSNQKERRQRKLAIFKRSNEEPDIKTIEEVTKRSRSVLGSRN